MKKFKKQAEDEIKALNELVKYLSDIPNISPLTKALLNKDIMDLQETLWTFWDIEIKGLDHFTISDEELRLCEVQMQSVNGIWVRVGPMGFPSLSGGTTIRLEREGTFFEANGKTEFLLTASPMLIQNTGEPDTWLVNYQI